MVKTMNVNEVSDYDKNTIKAYIYEIESFMQFKYRTDLMFIPWFFENNAVQLIVHTNDYNIYKNLDFYSKSYFVNFLIRLNREVKKSESFPAHCFTNEFIHNV